MSEGSRAKRKRRRFFSNIFVIFLLIIAFIQVKDKLFPAIKNIVIKNSSPFNDYVLADKDTLINEINLQKGAIMVLLMWIITKQGLIMNK